MSVPQLHIQKMSSSSSSSNSSSRSAGYSSGSSASTITSFNDFQVFKEHCFQCFRKLLENNDLQRCGSKCGAVFCDRACYRFFLEKHVREHMAICVSLNSLRQLLTSAEEQQQQQGKVTREKKSLLLIEVKNRSLAFDDIGESLSLRDKLLSTLLFCESVYVLKDQVRLWFVLKHCAELLVEASLHDKALLFLRTRLSIAGRMFGVNSKEHVLNSIHILTTLSALCRYDETDQQFRRVAPVCVAIFGKDSVEYAHLLDVRGTNLQALCKFDDALEAFDQSAMITRRLFGKNGTYAATISNMATVLCSLSQFETALEYFKDALDILEPSLVENHERRATLFLNIGHALMRLNRFADAKQSIEQSMQFWRRVGNRDSLASCWSSLGDIAQAENQLGVAWNYYKQALAIKREIYGVAHKHVARALGKISGVLYQLGEFDQALVICRESLAINVRLFGETHAAVASDCTNIGSILALQRDFDGAIAYYQRSLTIYEKIFDSEEEQVNRVTTAKALKAVKLKQLAERNKSID